MDILDLLTNQLGNENVLKELSKTANADPSQIQKAVSLGVPALLESLVRNAKTEEGALSLAKALDSHKDDKVDDIEGFLKNVDMEDGSKILGHILGGNKQKVQKNLAAQTGLQDNQVHDILKQLAPLLLGSLGKQKTSKNVGSDGLQNMLAGVLAGQASKNNGIMDSVT
ncbi:DUF937 domain-containing protein, partial [Sedimentibacter sp.]|uniref:DUF937 domain-containing protein n=1 Tax=Sedimentibacter sp. TaxID=1960295 RepID=UPI0028A022B9